jgi:protein SCO1
MDRKFIWVGSAILVLVLAAFAITFFVMRSQNELHGSVVDPPYSAPDFTLTGQDGKPVRLSDFRGKYVLLFFGFTRCTEECPATMAILAKARSELGTQAELVQVFFVSTDPANDTPQAITEFLNRFDSTFAGATGLPDELQQVWSAYGVTVEDGGETHSSYVYLIDPQGNLRMTYPYPSTPEEIAADLKLLIAKK